MNPFLCVIDLDGGALGLDAVTGGLSGLTRGDGRVEVLLHDCWAGAWVPASWSSRPAITHRQGVIALGNVRLSNRRVLADSALPVQQDIDLVVERYLDRGPAGVRDLVGDFAFVLWDTRKRVLVAARDGLGVKTLFYQRRGNRIAFASHLECLELGGYDRDFVGHFVLGYPMATTKTMFAGVTRLAAGSYLLAERGKVRTETYWSPSEFAPVESVVDEREAVEQFRALFSGAVAAQLDGDVSAWAQLSGGLDSSSVVSMAQSLAATGVLARGLDGTLTVVDSLSEGDETRYSDAVLAQYPLPNAQIVDYWAWQPDAQGAPRYAEPRNFLPFFARDREMCRVVRDGGARVMLSGMGPDHYLAGPFDYIGDLVARGRLGAGFRELTDLAVTTRQSFWSLGYRHALYPNAPAWLKRRSTPVPLTVPSWLRPEFVAEFELDRRMARADLPRTGRGTSYADQIAAETACLDLALERGVFEEGVEVRYPFLHRPLVEFSLRLPATMRARAHQQKGILRSAMEGLLPEAVRTRPGKGGIDGRVIWSFAKERAVLEGLVANSQLVELGCVDRDQLRAALAAAVAGQSRSIGLLFVTLSLESWFAVRSGRPEAAGVLSAEGRRLSITHFNSKEQEHDQVPVH